MSLNQTSSVALNTSKIINTQLEVMGSGPEPLEIQESDGQLGYFEL